MILVLIITAFTVVNAAPVSVNFIFTKVEVSLALIILISALFGALILFLIGLFDSRKKTHRTKQLESENFNLKQRITVYEREKEEQRIKEDIQQVVEPTEHNEVL